MPELAPFRRAASVWLEGKALSDPFVLNAKQALEQLLEEAGPILPIPQLRYETSESKAQQALARLREARVPAMKVLLEVLATMAALRFLDGFPRGEDYHLTQIGKRVHRMAKGYDWKLTFPDGTVKHKQWHPEPRGQMLRHLGRHMLKVIDRGFGDRDIAAIGKLAVQD